MAQKLTKNDRRLKVHRRIRYKISGSAERPRLCVYRSLNHIYAQLVDDVAGSTLASASTLALEGKKLENGGNIAAAKKVGQQIAGEAKRIGVENVVFDRGGYLYHGRVKALAEAAREAGLKF